MRFIDVILKTKIAVILVLAALIVLLVLAYDYVADGKSTDTNTKIYLDTESSIVITVNNQDKVTDISALDKKGQEILEDELKQDLNIAVSRIVDELLAKGHLSNEENTVLVTASGSPKTCSRILRTVVDDIKWICDMENVDVSAVSQILVSSKANIDIPYDYLGSKSKSQYICDIVSVSDFTFENLQSLSISDLNYLSFTKNLKLERVVETLGKPSESKYINSEKVKEITAQALNIPVNALTEYSEALGVREGAMTYRVLADKDSLGYAVYIDAKTGSVQDVQKEEEKEPEKSVRSEQSKETKAGETKSGNTEEKKTDTQLKEETSTNNKAENTAETSQTGSADNKKTQQNKNNNTKSDGSVNRSEVQSVIGNELAKQIVLTHAKETEENINFLSIELKTQDSQKIYQVEFETQNAEYLYILDAESGNITKYTYTKLQNLQINTEPEIDTTKEQEASAPNEQDLPQEADTEDTQDKDAEKLSDEAQMPKNEFEE